MKNNDENRRSGHERRNDVATTIEKTARTNNRVSKLVMFCLALIILLVIYVFITEHDGRQSVVKAARAGCERDKQDRTAAVILDNDIVGIFREVEDRNPNIVSPARDRLLNHIQVINNGLEFRAHIDCVERYPSASWFP